MDTIKIKEIMFDLFDKYDNYDDIKDALRNLHTYGDVSDQEYNYCLEHWDEILLDWESKI